MFWLPDGSSCQVAAPDRLIGHRAASTDDRAWRELVRLAACEAQAATGRIALHAGAVTVERRGALIVGPPGSGKSTLVYAAARAGASYTADDVTWISRDGPTWYAGGGNAIIRLRTPVEPGDDVTADEGVDDAGKWCIRFTRKGAFQECAPLAALVLLGSTRAAVTSWRPLERRETLVGLMGEAALALSPAVAGRQLGVLGELARLPAVRLTGGCDLLEDATRALAVLRAILGSACGDDPW